MPDQPFDSRRLEQIGGVLHVARERLIIEEREGEIALRGLHVDLGHLDLEPLQIARSDGGLEHELDLKQRIAARIALPLDRGDDEIERRLLVGHRAEHPVADPREQLADVRIAA